MLGSTSLEINYYQLKCIEYWDKERPHAERLTEAKMRLCEAVDNPPHGNSIDDLGNILRCVAILAYELHFDLESIARSDIEKK